MGEKNGCFRARTCNPFLGTVSLNKVNMIYPMSNGILSSGSSALNRGCVKHNTNTNTRVPASPPTILSLSAHSSSLALHVIPIHRTTPPFSQRTPPYHTCILTVRPTSISRRPYHMHPTSKPPIGPCTPPSTIFPSHWLRRSAAQMMPAYSLAHRSWTCISQTLRDFLVISLLCMLHADCRSRGYWRCCMCGQRRYLLFRALPCSIYHRERETSSARGFGGTCGAEACTTCLRVYEENRDWKENKPRERNFDVV